MPTANPIWLTANGNTASTFGVWLWNGAGFTPSPANSSGPYANPGTLATGDFNGHGRADFVLAINAVPNVVTTYLGVGFGPPATITPVGGNNQGATVTTAFGQPLAARVADAAGNGLLGVTVTFTPPPSGASATLSSLTVPPTAPPAPTPSG